MVQTTDVIVIGGGVVGAAVVHELSERGLDTVLLERDLPNRQGSGTTAGNLHIQAIHAERPDQDVPVDTAQLVPLQARTSELWRDLESRLDTDLGIAVRGGLTVAETPAQIELLREKARWEHAAGIPTEVIDGDEARVRAPQLGSSVLAATWCPWDGWANNLLITPAYLSAARRLGSKVLVHSPVIGIDRVGSTWTVTTPHGSLSAPVVVNAAGPWLGEVSALAGYRLAMAPLAIQMLETVRAAPRLSHLIQHIGEGLSVKQLDTGTVVIGGGWPAGQFELGQVSPVSSQSVDGNLDQVRRVLPGLAGIRIARAWTGPLAATADEMPVVGSMPDDSNFYVVGGTYAFTFSPVWAGAIADSITGRDPAFDLSTFAPERLVDTTRIGI